MAGQTGFCGLDPQSTALSAVADPALDRPVAERCAQAAMIEAVCLIRRMRAEVADIIGGCGRDGRFADLACVVWAELARRFVQDRLRSMD